MLRCGDQRLFPGKAMAFASCVNSVIFIKCHKIRFFQMGSITGRAISLSDIALKRKMPHQYIYVKYALFSNDKNNLCVIANDLQWVKQ